MFMMMKSQIEKVAKALSQMCVDRKRDKQTPVPIQQDLERKFRMRFSLDQNSVVQDKS